MAHGTDDANTLARHIAAYGSPLPGSLVDDFASAVGHIIGKQAPATMQARRAFVEDWVRDRGESMAARHSSGSFPALSDRPEPAGEPTDSAGHVAAGTGSNQSSEHYLVPPLNLGSVGSCASGTDPQVLGTGPSGFLGDASSTLSDASPATAEQKAQGGRARGAAKAQGGRARGAAGALAGVSCGSSAAAPKALAGLGYASDEEDLSSGIWVDPDELVRLVLAIGKAYGSGAAPPEQVAELRELEEQSRSIARSRGIEYPEHPDDMGALMRGLHDLARRAILADRPDVSPPAAAPRHGKLPRGADPPPGNEGPAAGLAAADRRARSAEAAAAQAVRRAEAAEAEARAARRAAAKEASSRQAAEGRAAAAQSRLTKLERASASPEQRPAAEAADASAGVHRTPLAARSNGSPGCADAATASSSSASDRFPQLCFSSSASAAASAAAAAAATAAAARDEAELRAIRAEWALERVRQDASLHDAARHADLAAVAAMQEATMHMRAQLPSPPARNGGSPTFVHPREAYQPPRSPGLRPSTAPGGRGIGGCPNGSHYACGQSFGAWAGEDDWPRDAVSHTAVAGRVVAMAPPAAARGAVALPPRAQPAPAAARTPRPAPTPRDTASLLSMLDGLTGGSSDAVETLPLRSLQTAAQAIAAVTLKRVPTPVRQKRFFVSSWYAEARKASGLSPPPLPSRRPEDLFSEIDARLRTQRNSITQPELPDAVCAQFADEIVKLEGRASLHGRPTHEKRLLVHEWHEAYARRERLAAVSPEPPPPVCTPHESPPRASPGAGGDWYGATAEVTQHRQASASVPLRVRGRPDLAGTVIIIE